MQVCVKDKNNHNIIRIYKTAINNYMYQRGLCEFYSKYLSKYLLDSRENEV